MKKRSRLYFGCAAAVATILAGQLKAEVRSFGTLQGEYTLIEAVGPTRNEPEKFSYQDSRGNTVNGSVWCRDDQAIGTVFPGSLQNFTVDTTSRRVSFIQDGDPVSFTAPFLHANVGGFGGTVVKGDITMEESESPDPTVRIVYKTEATVYFNTLQLGNELKSDFVETTTYYVNNQAALNCREAYQVRGYVFPRPPAPPDPTLLEQLWGSAYGALLRKLGFDPTRSYRSASGSTVTGVRG